MPEFLANSLITFYVLCSGSLKTRLILPGLGMEWLAVCNGSVYYKLSESLGCRKRAHMKPKTRAKVYSSNVCSLNHSDHMTIRQPRDSLNLYQTNGSWTLIYIYRGLRAKSWHSHQIYFSLTWHQTTHEFGSNFQILHWQIYSRSRLNLFDQKFLWKRAKSL